MKNVAAIKQSLSGKQNSAYELA